MTVKRSPMPTKRERAAADVPEAEPYRITIASESVLVPYVAAWSSEMPDFRVAPEPLLGGKIALFRASGRRGEGKPVLGKMDPGRQRRCILRSLCQVCAQPMRPEDAWYALLEERVTVPGLDFVDAVREPAACARCMADALLLCPGLRREPGLRVVQAGRTITIGTVTEAPVGGRGPLPEIKATYTDLEQEQRRAGAVIGYLKVVLLDLRQSLPPAHFVVWWGERKRSG